MPTLGPPAPPPGIAEALLKERGQSIDPVKSSVLQLVVVFESRKLVLCSRPSAAHAVPRYQAQLGPVLQKDVACRGAWHEVEVGAPLTVCRAATGRKGPTPKGLHP